MSGAKQPKSRAHPKPRKSRPEERGRRGGSGESQLPGLPGKLQQARRGQDVGGIRACLVPPAPNSAGKSLIGLRGRRSCTIRQSGLDPSAIPSSGHNSPRDKLIKPPYPGKEVQSDCRGFYFRRHSLHLALAEWKLPFCPNG